MSKINPKNHPVFLTGICALLGSLLLIYFINRTGCPVYEPGSPELSAGGFSLCSLKLASPAAASSDASETNITASPDISEAIFHLDASANPASLSLYVPNDRDCTLTVNGRTYTSSLGQEYLVCPLSDFVPEHTAVTIHAVISSPYDEDPYFSNRLLYLGSDSRIYRLIQSGSFQRFSVIGIAFTILLYSLSLYAGNPSEKYLLPLALLAYSTSARTLWNALPMLKHLPVANLLLLGTMDFPYLTQPQDYHLSFLVLKFLIAWLRSRLLLEFVPITIGRRSYFHWCAAVALALLPLSFLGHGYYAIQAWMLTVHLLELYVLARRQATATSVPTRAVLASACGLTMAFRLYDVICTMNLLPHGYLEAALKPQGIIETFYIIAFVVIINLKFARKYREAERLSASLEEVNRTLEHKVDERTRELSDTLAKLNGVQQQKLEFLSGILHNLKTPLFSLYGYTDMALDELLEEPELARRHMLEVNKNADYVRQMIDNLFLCIRLEDGKVHYNRTPFLVSMLLDQLRSTSAPKASAAGIALEFAASDASVVLNADLLYIRQALQNIIDNAIRHSPSGSVIYIHARLHPAPDKCFVCITIRDHGEGISPEELPLIFSRYFSGGHKGASSSGLGLTITKSIVEQHEGWIEVDSELNRGTEFRVFLPAG